MARILPSDLSQLDLAGGNPAELQTVKLLRKRLPDDYVVFHGVHWSREYAKWTHFGEVDFVVINQSGDVLLVEQKNGPVSETEQGLVKTYENGEKNVNDQIRRSVDKVRQKFEWQHGRQSKLALDYLIYCPDYSVRNVNAAALDMRRIVDGSALDGIVARIENVLGPGIAKDNVWYDRVVSFFRQTLDLVPDIHAHVRTQEVTFVRRVGGVNELLSRLEMCPLRLRIKGTAGCGKSLLAREAFDRAARAGRKPLLVCFNRNLSERLKACVSPGGYVDTWNGFCARFLESLGHQLNFGSMKRNPRFWAEVQEQVMGAQIPNDWIFDVLIVDEGQDFEQEWYDILRLFLHADADILWLEDTDQNIYAKPGVALNEFVGYRADVNHRSPELVARFIHDTLPFKFDLGNELPGLGVEVHNYVDPQDQIKSVGKVVRRLLKQGFEHNQIVILTCQGFNNSVFTDCEKVANLPLRRFTGDYDLFGNQVLTEGKLTFDSVYRYKGQEAPAVILVDVDPNPDSLDRAWRVLFCGMTRATVRLDVLVNINNPENARFASY